MAVTIVRVMTDPFNANLVRLMREKNLSVPQVIERTGIPKSTVYDYYSGRHTPILGHPHRALIARALRVRVGRLNNEEATDGGPKDRGK